MCWESSHGSGKSSPSPDAVHYYYYCFVARPATTRAQPTTATGRSGRCACNPLTFGGKRQSCNPAIRQSQPAERLGTTFFFFILDSTKGKAAARGPPDKATRSAATPEQLYLVPPLLLLLLPHAAPFCLIIMMLILLLATRLPFFLRLHGGRATETASRSRRDFSVSQL